MVGGMTGIFGWRGTEAFRAASSGQCRRTDGFRLGGLGRLQDAERWIASARRRDGPFGERAAQGPAKAQCRSSRGGCHRGGFIRARIGGTACSRPGRHVPPAA
jgi:hypothetical protein